MSLTYSSAPRKRCYLTTSGFPLYVHITLLFRTRSCFFPFVYQLHLEICPASTVFLDLRALGQTSCTLSPTRSPDARRLPHEPLPRNPEDRVKLGLPPLPPFPPPPLLMLKPPLLPPRLPPRPLESPNPPRPLDAPRVPPRNPPRPPRAVPPRAPPLVRFAFSAPETVSASPIDSHESVTQTRRGFGSGQKSASKNKPVIQA